MLITRQIHYASNIGLDEKEIYLYAQRDTFLIGFVISVLAIFLIINIPHQRKRTIS